MLKIDFLKKKGYSENASLITEYTYEIFSTIAG